MPDEEAVFDLYHDTGAAAAVLLPSGCFKMSDNSEEVGFLPQFPGSHIHSTHEASSGIVSYAPVLHKEHVHFAGWLWKAYGTGPQQTWKRQWVRQFPEENKCISLKNQHTMDQACLSGLQFYLLDDRLCYTHAPSSGQVVRYLPLDRIPVRPLPRHYGPHISVSKISSSQVLRRPQGSVIAVHCGRRTHFMAAESAVLATVSRHYCIFAF